MNKVTMISAMAVLVLAAACGGANNSSEGTSAATEVAAPATTEESAPAAVTAELALEGNDMMQFDKHEFRVKAGERVRLTFKNVGELPKESMGHNVVILSPGTDVAAFGGEAIKAANNDYIPLTFKSSIVAHTKLLGPGETDAIEFTLADKGEYVYVCSFPGHYGIMQGKIIAE